MRSRGVLVGASSLVLAALLVGCAGHRPSRPAASASTEIGTPKGSGHGYYKIGSPYQVDGVWYYPGVDYGYDESGIASWYGPDFHGKFTANGEVYNMNDLTAAHPTLPLPSIVRVTNLENGRAIVVRINDRGPYVRGRIIDLSRRAAQLLGMIGTGTAKVRVQIMADDSRQVALLAQQGEIPSVERIAAAAPTAKITAEALAPPPGIQAAPAPRQAAVLPKRAPAPRGPVLIASAEAAVPAGNPTPAGPLIAPPQTKPAQPPQAEMVSVVPVSPTSIYVQVGAFGQYDNANRLRAKLTSLGPTKVTQANVDGQPFFRVRMGPAGSVSEADQLLGRLVNAGYHDARIVVE